MLSFRTRTGSHCLARITVLTLFLSFTWAQNGTEQSPVAVQNMAAAVPPTVSPALPQNNTSSTAAAATDVERFSIIVVFRDLKSVLSLRAICHPNPVVFRLRAAPLGLPADCHMPGICRRVYSTAVYGFSGQVTNDELAKVHKCLPKAIWYRELDGAVYKAEDSSIQRRSNSNNNNNNSPLELIVGGGGGGGDSQRRLLQQTNNINNAAAVDAFGTPLVHSFQEFDTSRSTEGSPIDLNNITGGAGGALSAPGEKSQSLGPILWNLDRVDQRDLPLDNKFSYGTSSLSGTGAGVTIYTIDSGIIKSHQEFQKAGSPGTSRASFGFDFVEDDEDATDCDGHGTHVSATTVGMQVGIAKDANIVSVRILDCSGSGTISDTVAALDWVAANAKKPAIATLSLGIQVGSWSRVLEDAVRSVVKLGVTVIVASGNSAVDACQVSPANVPEVITVAASDLKTKYNGTSNKGDPENIYKWSNTGPCIDIFAPGVDIFSACGGQSRCDEVKDDAYTYASGTSMAVPLVAGVAALYLEANPGATPAQVAAALTGGSTQNVLKSDELKKGTPNRLVYSKVAVKEVAAANGP